MARIFARLVRSPARRSMLEMWKAARQEVENAIDNEVKPAALAIAEDIVSNWTNKPTFVASKYVSSDSIALHLEPTGPNAKFWGWTSQGTEPHTIIARNAPFLVFKTDYEPKTMAGPPPTWGGSGESKGRYVRKRFVEHPGTKPRNLENYIKEYVEYGRIIENAFRRGLRGT